MPSTEAPTWWADVQQEREDLAGPGHRPAEDWLGEDIDFVPRRRMTRRSETAPLPTHRAVDHEDAPDAALHGVFMPASESARSVTIELGVDGARPAEDVVLAAPAQVAHELRHLSAADDPFATPPPPPGTRRTVAIKGRPDEYKVHSLAQRYRGRTASDRVGHRPDRIALWAVVLGAILILVAATTSTSQAAVPHSVAQPSQAHSITMSAPADQLGATVRLSHAHR